MASSSSQEISSKKRCSWSWWDKVDAPKVGVGGGRKREGGGSMDMQKMWAAFVRVSTSHSNTLQDSPCASQFAHHTREESTPHHFRTSIPSTSSFHVGKKQSTLESSWKPILKEEVDRAVARYFYHDHIPFRAARSPYFKDMVKKIGQYGEAYVAPSSETLRTTLLEKEKRVVEAACIAVKSSWEKNGVSLIVDRWSDVRRRSIHGVVAYSRGEMYFLSSHDASSTGKSVTVLASEWATSIEIVGPSNVVCIVTDGEAANKEASHIIEDILSICSGVVRGLLLSDEFRGMLESRTQIGRELIQLAENGAWWEELHTIDKMVNQSYIFYGLVEEISEICISRWNSYYSPLHAAAYVLDPEFQSRKQYTDKEIMGGWMKVLERLVPSDIERRAIWDELAMYRNGKQGLLHSLDAQEDRFRVGGALWWEDYGASTSKLQALAIRILSQACSSSCLDQLWSVYAHVGPKKRNRLGVQKASDLVYVSCNLKMLSKVDKADPFTEWELKEDDIITPTNIEEEEENIEEAHDDEEHVTNDIDNLFYHDDVYDETI
ncbi:hypothetical protein KP509_26G055900 [Ceratopteris richardii]|uniref:DUF659 domain-containing protein n=1 Tax=Ceratopteris richardii TaxID=49495 RepID=A0A8T2RNR9_CERRI|nr:hypothetical protein KP509_26G055900 [Ceratopteris richardii]